MWPDSSTKSQKIFKKKWAHFLARVILLTWYKKKNTKYKPLQNGAWQLWNISFILKINGFSNQYPVSQYKSITITCFSFKNILTLPSAEMTYLTALKSWN